MEGMKQQAQRALDELYDLAKGSIRDPHGLAGRHYNKVKAVIDAPDAVDVDALKQTEPNYMLNSYDQSWCIGHQHGWNAAIDHLASRNLIRTKADPCPTGGLTDNPSCSTVGCPDFTDEIISVPFEPTRAMKSLGIAIIGDSEKAVELWKAMIRSRPMWLRRNNGRGNI